MRNASKKKFKKINYRSNLSKQKRTTKSENTCETLQKKNSKKLIIEATFQNKSAPPKVKIHVKSFKRKIQKI